MRKGQNMDHNVSRRQVLKAAAGTGVLLAVPALQSAALADAQWVNVGTPDLFKAGVPTAVALPDGSPAYVTRTDDKTLTATSGKCTHRGCTLAWVGADKHLECPCHGAAF